MKILAVDSTTEFCSVALLDSETNLLVSEVEQAPRQHSQRLLSMVDQLLAQQACTLSELSAIAYGKGPGSFTGLRICLGLVQGLAFGANLPVVPISSLAALAQAAIDQHLNRQGLPIVAALDARMDEIYWGVFSAKEGMVTALGEEGLSSPEASYHEFSPLLPAEAFLAVGSGWQYQQRMTLPSTRVVVEGVYPQAAAIAKLAAKAFVDGEFCSADQAQPTYLRDQVTWKKIAEQ